MNDEQLDLVRRLAAHPRFEWRRGMAALESPPSGNWQPGDREWRVVSGSPDVAAITSENEIHEAPYMPSAFARAVPDLTDAATGGVLLDMLGPNWNTNRTREWDDANDGPDRDRWFVWKTAGMKVVYRGTTLAEACARALLAEWGEAQDGQ